MGRPANVIPKYGHHKPSDQARVRVNGEDIYLGKYNSAASRKEYNRICAELEVTEPAEPKTRPAKTSARTVGDVLTAFWKHARKHYRHPDGKPTSEVKYLTYSAALLNELYGHSPADRFGPLSLKAVREKWVKTGLARSGVNGRVNRIRRIFKWAASEELVPFSVYQSLTTVAGLQAGRGVKEAEPVSPVSGLHVATVAASTVPTLRAMILVQRLTGMRPGELCVMKAGEVDRSSSPWVYSPAVHKTSYRGGVRHVLIGPIAAEILRPFLDGRQPGEAVFTPKMTRVDRLKKERAVSTHYKRIPESKLPHPPRELYDSNSYGAAIRRACVAAGVPEWSPNQLRHSFATEVRELFGLEAAQVLLGHTRADVTQTYAERNAALGKRVAAAMG